MNVHSYQPNNELEKKYFWVFSKHKTNLFKGRYFKESENLALKITLKVALSRK